LLFGGLPFKSPHDKPTSSEVQIADVDATDLADACAGSKGVMHNGPSHDPLSSAGFFVPEGVGFELTEQPLGFVQVQDPVWVELGIPGGFFLRGLFKLGWLITAPHTSRIVPLSELVKEKLRRL